MLRYFLKRFGLMLLTFIITVFLFFVFIKLIPQNKPQAAFGNDNEAYLRLAAIEGWDKPIIVQFFIWIKNIFVNGSFGFSYLQKRDVSEYYFGRIPASIKINLVPYFLSIPIAISLGVVAATHKNKFLDNFISVGIIVFISIPYFVVASLSQYIFYYKLNWAVSPDVASSDKGFFFTMASYLLPVCVMTVSGIPGLARSVRAELTEELTKDYVLLAMSKGLTKKQAIYRHALKNALVPFLPGIFIGIIGIMNGGIITEQIFRVNGTGAVYLESFNAQDYPMLMMITTFSQFLGLLSGIVADISYTLFDPRIRFGGGKSA